MNEPSRSVDVSWAVPAIAAILAALIGILGTIFIAGRTDYVTVREYAGYKELVTEKNSQLEKEISNLDGRLSHLEGQLENKKR